MVTSTVATLAAALVGCAPPLGVSLRAAGATPPSQVAMMIEVGAPTLPTEHDLSLREDGVSLDPARARLTLLDPRDAIAERTVVLVDASASVVESGQIGDVASATARLVTRLEKLHRVAVAAWDGADGVIGIVPFSAKAEVADRRLDALLTLRPRGRGSRMNAAIIEAIEALDRAQRADGRPLRIGHLVIVAGSSDDAQSTSLADVRRALRSHPELDVRAVGIGEVVELDPLRAIAPSRTSHARKLERLPTIFDGYAETLEREAAHRLLVSYCSAARDGRHEATLKLRVGDKEGAVGFSFSARGFRDGCDPDRPPTRLEPPTTERRREGKED
jgi:hypothetical protein